MTTNEIQQILKKWKKRLGLSDWTITVDKASQEHIGGQAKARIYNESQTAKLYILDEADRQKTDPNDQDIEHDIIHELLHIRLWSFDPIDAKGNDHVLREQAIDWIARGLTLSDRGK